jgi:Zn-dependent protease with chaperone function
VASLYVADPLPRAGLATLFATHPPIAELVRQLRGYDAGAAVGYPA